MEVELSKEILRTTNRRPQPKAAGSVSAQAPVGVESFEDTPVSQMRKVIAKRLGESKYSAPHFYLTIDIRYGSGNCCPKSNQRIARC